MNNNTFITTRYESSSIDPSNLIEQKQYTPAKAKFLERHVAWIRNKNRPLLAKICVLALVAFEVTALALSLVGIGVLIEGLAIRKTMKNMEKFNKEINTGMRMPPAFDTPPLISKTATSNVANYYAINDDTIWFKPLRDKNAEWKPIYFDGYSKQRKPIEIQVDGANLIVIDDKNQIHYKKVINEYRDKEDHHYVYLDKSTKNNWKDRWYSFPVLNVVCNSFTGKLLTLPQDTKAWAISQRRILNNYLEDGKGAKHYAEVGVTTLYTLKPDGKTVKIYDPWVNKNADISFYMPETSHSSFSAENIAAGSSTLAAIGYESTPDSNKGGVNKKLTVYTQLADIDSVGWDPGIKCSYPCEEPDDEKITVPFAKWVEHPLNLDKEASVTKNIRVIQTGQGNNARVIMVEGKNKNGDTGYFYKKIDDTEWSFHIDGHQIANSLNPEIYSHEPFEAIVHDFNGSVTKKDNKIDEVILKLKNHGKHNYVSTLELSVNGKKIDLIYNKRKTLKNFIGLKKHTHEIALPHESEVEEDLQPYLKKIFGNKKVLKVSAKENSQTLRLKLPRGICFNFEK